MAQKNDLGKWPIQNGPHPFDPLQESHILAYAYLTTHFSGLCQYSINSPVSTREFSLAIVVLIYGDPFIRSV